MPIQFSDSGLRFRFISQTRIHAYSYLISQIQISYLRSRNHSHGDSYHIQVAIHLQIPIQLHINLHIPVHILIHACLHSDSTSYPSSNSSPRMHYSVHACSDHIHIQINLQHHIHIHIHSYVYITFKFISILKFKSLYSYS